MKYFTFFRENNKFDDILNDPLIKPLIDERTRWWQHLMLGVQDNNEQSLSFITLKYGDEMVTQIVKDRSPVPGVDYVQKKNPSLFKKRTS